MTHALGQGTANFSINMRRSESALLTLEALRAMEKGRFRSVGGYIKHLVLVGLEAENPDAAQRLRAIRNAAMSAALALLVMAQTTALALGWVDDDGGLIARRVRSVRSVKVAGRRFETEA